MLLLIALVLGCGAKNADPASAGAGRLDWPAACPSPSDPRVHYQHDTWKERDLCERIRFHCEDGQEPIESPNGVDCGCGCIDTTQAPAPAP